MLRELREAAKRRDAAEEAREQAVDELVAAIQRCRDAGVPLARIARELHTSRQSVYKLLGRSPER